MPWKECQIVEERLKFIARLLDGEKMTTLCIVTRRRPPVQPRKWPNRRERRKSRNRCRGNGRHYVTLERTVRPGPRACYLMRLARVKRLPPGPISLYEPNAAALTVMSSPTASGSLRFLEVSSQT